MVVIVALHLLLVGGSVDFDLKLPNLMLTRKRGVKSIDHGSNKQPAAGLDVARSKYVAYTPESNSTEAACGAHKGVPQFRCAAWQR